MLSLSYCLHKIYRKETVSELQEINEIDTADRMSMAWLASAKESEGMMDEDDRELYQAIEGEAIEVMERDRV